MKSPKELSIDKKIATALDALMESFEDKTPSAVLKLLLNDPEIECIQNYGNAVSIKRLGFNDHGPVHMRTVALNAIKMLTILHSKGIKTSLEKEETGTFVDSVTAVLLASMMHDFGMTIGRQDHELYSAFFALPIIERILKIALPLDSDLNRRVVIRSLAMEGIVGHMGTRRIHSVEAGLILIADGCDMTKGRARIPMELSTQPHVGDIHKYSANSIEKVEITDGIEKPIRINVSMSGDVGFFQIEEVLLQKVNSSPAKAFVELLAGVDGCEMKQYL
ncbi:MAG: phosphohydrolase [Treponema sp.]|nr:phosphohydrolase [Treponema sp.]